LTAAVVKYKNLETQHKKPNKIENVAGSVFNMGGSSIPT
jgi:hypothetical protein